ncbi:MAG TPA: hypothetical protein VMV01_08510 [Planctomycetota bacterium]|nr:hypothetical protein [Planctomycetota bacterium]
MNAALAVALVPDDDDAVAADGELRFSPTKAVLHRSAEAAGDGPSCVKVLEA